MRRAVVAAFGSLALVSMTTLAPLAQAAEVPIYQVLFEAVCIGSGLDNAKIGPLVEAMAEGLKGSATPMPVQQLTLSGPDNKEGWIVTARTETLFVMRGEKIDGDVTSASCIIGLRQDDPSDIISFVEKGFKTIKLIDERQGGSHFLVYSADLIGMTGRHAVGIQAGNGVVMLSLFQMP